MRITISPQHGAPKGYRVSGNTVHGPGWSLDMSDMTAGDVVHSPVHCIVRDITHDGDGPVLTLALGGISEYGQHAGDGDIGEGAEGGDPVEWSVHVPPAPTVADVKAEAMRRILAICTEWRQRNLTARAAELADKGRANWTADELAEWNAGAAIWAQIKHIREVSDQIESIDPIPADYTSDHYWE